jgi:hypothetical protein
VKSAEGTELPNLANDDVWWYHQGHASI